MTKTHIETAQDNRATTIKMYCTKTDIVSNRHVNTKQENLKA